MDRRPLLKINFASDALMHLECLRRIVSNTADGFESKVPFGLAWVLRAHYYSGIGVSRRLQRSRTRPSVCMRCSPRRQAIRRMETLVDEINLAEVQAG